MWWTDVSAFKKENLRAEDARVKSLVKRILVEDSEERVGPVRIIGVSFDLTYNRL